MTRFDSLVQIGDGKTSDVYMVHYTLEGIWFKQDDIEVVIFANGKLILYMEHVSSEKLRFLMDCYDLNYNISRIRYVHLSREQEIELTRQRQEAKRKCPQCIKLREMIQKC